MTDEYAYSTGDPAALAAYRETREAVQRFAEALKVDCEALGGNDGAYVRFGVWGGRNKIFGLIPDGSGTIPDGWRLVRDQLEPRRGKPGEAAREWLDAHQPPDVRHAMTGHGLPRHSSVPSGTGGYLMKSPVLFEHDDTLWACYEGKPGDRITSTEAGCTWTPRKLSEFHAAREAVAALAEAETAEVA
jgi:hypothetical protein